MIKRLPLLALIAMLLISAISVKPGLAQSEPTAIVDAAFSALSTKLGVTVTRNTVDSFRWGQNVYDGSLGPFQRNKLPIYTRDNLDKPFAETR
jgi:hypothetical protein